MFWATAIEADFIRNPVKVVSLLKRIGQINISRLLAPCFVPFYGIYAQSYRP